MTPLVLLALTVAAPVPKAGPKMEEVFGEIADPKGACKFEVGKGGALTITVPKEHRPGELKNRKPVPPLVVKCVEGDFELTVRIQLDPPKTAAEKSEAVSAGIAIVSEADPEWSSEFVCSHAGNLDSKWVSGLTQRTQSGWKCAGGAEHDKEPVSLRIVRRGDDLSFDVWDADRKEWAQFKSRSIAGRGAKLLVGPVAYQCGGVEFNATLDQYEIKPLKEVKK